MIRDSGTAWQAVRITTSAALLMIGLAALLAACGGSGAASTRRHIPGGSPRAATSAARLTLPDRLLLSGRLPGFHSLATPTVTRSAPAWDAVAWMPGSLSPNEAAWLERHGFVAGVRERLVGNFGSTAEVYSAVEEFHSSTAARAEVAHRYLQSRHARPMSGVRLSRFSVPGVPAAIGYDMTAADASRQTILFAAGRFDYFVSSGTPASVRGAPSRARLLAAATAWSRRMRAGWPL